MITSFHRSVPDPIGRAGSLLAFPGCTRRRRPARAAGFPQPVADGVVGRLCDAGTAVDYRRNPLADHGSILGAPMNDLLAWVAQRFTARPPVVADVCPLGAAARR